MKPAIERFLEKIKVTETGCWEWTAYRNPLGYASMFINYKSVLIHRFIYEYYHSDIDPTLTIDHICRNRACANPSHLRQMTQKENNMIGNSIPARNARKTHCKRGHLLCQDNLYLDKNNHRHCRICDINNSKIYHILHREQKLERMKQNYRNNCEKRKLYQKQYRLKMKEYA